MTLLRIYRYGLLLFISYLGFACTPEMPAEKELAFYHWQTRLEIDTTEYNLLSNLGTKKVYAKFFDVDWDASRRALVPNALVRIDSQSLACVQELVPTIFITNRSFLNSSSDQQERLVQQVVKKVKELRTGLPTYLLVEELQIDCDWTERTRAAFFSFLNAIKEEIQGEAWSLSVTIRLHQWANPDGTGVPPADRGMLMFYNMGDLSSWQENNSILNLEAAWPYLPKNKDQYPLKLDLALPAYSWGVLYRDGEMIRLLNDLQVEDLRDTSFYEKLSPFRFRVQKSNYLKGHYLYADDLLRVEVVQIEDLQVAWKELKPYFEKEDFTLAIYHLDAKTLKAMPYARLHELLD